MGLDLGGLDMLKAWPQKSLLQFILVGQIWRLTYEQPLLFVLC